MDVYLKIESIANYNPVNPQPKPMQVYRRDCMRGMGHEDGNIPPSEILARGLTALVYREYLDSAYTIPKPDKLVLADINEPVYYARVPGTVIYVHPGERLHIHVLNGAAEPHSFHLHGLRYGIETSSTRWWAHGLSMTQRDAFVLAAPYGRTQVGTVDPNGGGRASGQEFGFPGRYVQIVNLPLGFGSALKQPRNLERFTKRPISATPVRDRVRSAAPDAAAPTKMPRREIIRPDLNNGDSTSSLRFCCPPLS